MIMDYVGGMFIPEDPEGSERITIADQPVILYKPDKKIVGMTFVLTAANMPLSKYQSIIDALLSINHVVVGIFVNVIKLSSNNHRLIAERIPMIFKALKNEVHVNRYDIVGHSIGGQIALIVAALYDSESLIRNIIALDPVDQNPVEFTNTKNTNENLSVENSTADIIITFTDTGYFIMKAHSARQIHKNNPSTKLILHRNSCHMVYCDDGGLLSWKALMGRGSSTDRNKVVKEQTLQLIKDTFSKSSMAGSASGKVTSIVDKAKKSVNSSINDARELAEDTKKKAGFLGAAKAYVKEYLLVTRVSPYCIALSHSFS